MGHASSRAFKVRTVRRAGVGEMADAGGEGRGGPLPRAGVPITEGRFSRGAPTEYARPFRSSGCNKYKYCTGAPGRLVAEDTSENNLRSVACIGGGLAKCLYRYFPFLSAPDIVTHRALLVIQTNPIFMNSVFRQQ